MVPYRVLVSGDRFWEDGELIRYHLEKLKKQHDDLELIVGDCSGADTYAKNSAIDLEIPYREFKANWNEGARGGPIRNQKMVNCDPNVVLAFHDNIDFSRGTKDCVRKAQKRSILVKVITHTEGAR